MIAQKEALPDEEHAQAESYPQLVARLSRQSVKKHFDAYADIAWDEPSMRIDPADPRFELSTEDGLGATAWYRAQPQKTRAEIGLHLLASFMKVGVQFENVLSRGLLGYAHTLPNHSAEFRYVYHEVIEESQHSLMFQEFLNRSGVDARALTGVRAILGEQVVRLGQRFPELFFLFVLGGEDPIDHVQRRVMGSSRDLHPLVRRISQIHITEEARHLCFARQYLREHVAQLSPARKLALTVLAPVVLWNMARAMLAPPPSLIARFDIPEPVVDEAWRKNPQHHAQVVASLGKVRALCVELGLLGPRSERVWRALGIA